MTQIFLDTANLEEIDKYLKQGIISGVTTNQKIFLKEKGCNFEERAQQILEAVYPLPVSLEGPNDYDGIIKAALNYQKWKSKKFGNLNNLVIKVPMLANGDGLKAVLRLDTIFRIKVNVTACMTLNQAFLAASAGATYVSLFYCRMKDWLDEEYALDTIKQTMKLFKGGKTQLIIGSIRSPDDITKILSVQPDIITIPPKILEQMPQNDMTDKTLKEFEEAWTEFKKAEK